MSARSTIALAKQLQLNPALGTAPALYNKEHILTAECHAAAAVAPRLRCSGVEAPPQRKIDVNLAVLAADLNRARYSVAFALACKCFWWMSGVALVCGYSAGMPAYACLSQSCKILV